MPGHEARESKIGSLTLISFALKRSPRSISIRLIGPCVVEPRGQRFSHLRGMVNVGDSRVPIFDDLALAGIAHRAITENSCVVFLGANSDFTDFRSAIIADDVFEVLALARKTCAKGQYVML